MEEKQKQIENARRWCDSLKSIDILWKFNASENYQS